MALRELLSSSQREAFEAIPLDRAGLIEHYVLSDQDLSLIRRRRGAQNRLGLAVQLALLRYPGRRCSPLRPRLQSFSPSWLVKLGFLPMRGQAMQSVMKPAGSTWLSCSFTTGYARSALDTIVCLRPG